MSYSVEEEETFAVLPLSMDIGIENAMESKLDDPAVLVRMTADGSRPDLLCHD